jgi:putative transposase
MVDQYQLSERRACRLVGLSRDSYRNPPEVDAKTQALSAAIIDLAHVRRRFGYRRLHDLLRPQYPGVNHKRIYRLYTEAKLTVKKRKKVKRPISERLPLQLAQKVNEVWSMDFVSDCLSSGRRIKCLTVADDFSHECVRIGVDYGISGQYVTRLLDQAALFRGYPRTVRTDNVLNAIGAARVGDGIRFQAAPAAWLAGKRASKSSSASASILVAPTDHNGNKIRSRSHDSVFTVLQTA